MRWLKRVAEYEGGLRFDGLRTVKGTSWKKSFGLKPEWVICVVAAVIMLFIGTASARQPDIAMCFDGDGAYIETTVNMGDLGIDGNSPRTVEAWVYTREFDDNGTVFSAGAPGNEGEDFALKVRGGDNQWRVQYWAGGDIDFSYPSKEKWVHFALVHTGEETIVYADGEEAVRASRELDTSTREPFRIGWWSHRSEDQSLDGMIADVRIWDHARSQENVEAYMHAELEGDEDGLVGYWPLSGKNEVVEDLAGNNEGRIIGAPELLFTTPFVEDLPSEMEAEPGESITLGPVELRQTQGEVTYQWYLDDEPVEGAVENTLEIPDFTVKDHGTYYVEVDDEGDVTPVESTRLRFLEWPVWKADLEEEKAVSQGDSAILGPVELYAPLGEVTYQWFLNDEAVDGATESSLELSDVTKNELGAYYVEVDDESDITPVQSSSVLVQPVSRWQLDLGTSVVSTPAVGRDGTVYAGGKDGTLYALEGDDGSEKWSFETGGALISSPTLCEENNVYVGSKDGFLYALNGDDGSKLWAFETDGSILSSPAIGEDGTVYVGSNDNHIYAISPDGSSRWSFETGGAVVPDVAVGGGDAIYAGSYDGMLYALAKSDGAEMWAVAIGGAVMTSLHAAEDARVYTGSSDKKLYAVNTEDGQIAWTFETGGRIRSAPAVDTDGTIYLNSLDGNMYALEPETGSKYWVFETEGEFASTPVIDENGTIYAGNTDSYLYAVGKNDGAMQWNFRAANPLRLSSPVLGADDTVIYISCHKGNVYAVEKFDPR